MNKKGFTLIELLIVIAIIGILSVALVPTGMSALKKARDGSRISNMASIKTAMQQYVLDKTGCPANAAALDSYFDSGKIPKDPKSSADYTILEATAANLPTYCVAVAELEYTDGKQGNYNPSPATTACSAVTAAAYHTAITAGLTPTATYKCHVVYIQK